MACLSCIRGCVFLNQSFHFFWQEEYVVLGIEQVYRLVSDLFTNVVNQFLSLFRRKEISEIVFKKNDGTNVVFCQIISHVRYDLQISVFGVNLDKGNFMWRYSVNSFQEPTRCVELRGPRIICVVVSDEIRCGQAEIYFLAGSVLIIFWKLL